MGKLEKVVVLVVLFVVALILGVSLNAPAGVGAAERPDDEILARAETQEAARSERAPVQRSAPAPEPTRPARTAPVTRPAAPEPAPAERRPAGTELVARAPESEAAAAGTRPLGPAGVLSTSNPAAAAPAPSAPADQEGEGYLRTLTGLAPSLSEEFMIYTWQEDDSFAAVSERYFGSRLHVNRLLRNNEGLEDHQLRAGDRILVPVGVAEEAAAGAWSGAATYKVQSGDVLGTISNTVYGTSKNWRKIYDANRDLLADPNRLEVGMVLRIPE